MEERIMWPSVTESGDDSPVSLLSQIYAPIVLNQILATYHAIMLPCNYVLFFNSILYFQIK